MENLKITFSPIDRLYYITQNDQEIHYQTGKPTEQDIAAAVFSNDWEARFKEIKKGKEVRVSDYIYYSMLESVPPKKHKGNSFFNGECFHANYYYFFEKRDGFCFGSLRDIDNGNLMDQEAILYVAECIKKPTV